MPTQQDLNELSGTDKAVFDIYKHVTTLCSGAIVVLAAFIGQRSIPLGDASIPLGFALVGFAVCIVLGVAGMCLLIREHSQVTTLLTRVYELVGGPRHVDAQELSRLAEHPDVKPLYKDATRAWLGHSKIKKALVIVFGLSMGCLIWFILVVPVE